MVPSLFPSTAWPNLVYSFTYKPPVAATDVSRYLCIIMDFDALHGWLIEILIYFGIVVTLRAPILLPWKAFSKQTIFVLVHWEPCAPHGLLFERPTIFSDFAGNLECTFICLYATIREEDLKPAGSIGRLVARRKTKSTFTLGSRYKKRWELNDHSLWYTLLVWMILEACQFIIYKHSDISRYP